MRPTILWWVVTFYVIKQRDIEIIRIELHPNSNSWITWTVSYYQSRNAVCMCRWHRSFSISVLRDRQLQSRFLQRKHIDVRVYHCHTDNYYSIGIIYRQILLYKVKISWHVRSEETRPKRRETFQLWNTFVPTSSNVFSRFSFARSFSFRIDKQSSFCLSRRETRQTLFSGETGL